MTEVIELEREAAALCPVGHPKHALWANNLANTLYLSGELALQSEAITLATEALEGFAPGHPYRAKVCINVATMMRKQFETNQDCQLLTQAISLARDALQGVEPENPERVRACKSLGRLLIMDFESSGDTSLLFEAHVLLGEARDRTLPSALDR
jgi:hypothetical protein